MAQEDGKHKFAIEKLKKSVLFRLRALNPNVSINSEHVSVIEDRLQHLFKSFHTPTHPPYALMIKRAIVELNEESGSTEEAISELIRREYEDLPLAHVRVLDVHLRKLCLDGVLVCTHSGRFVFPVDVDNVKDSESNRTQRQINSRVHDVSADDSSTSNE